jgi:hypothetical protein
MANLVTQTDTARWIACVSSEARTNGDVVEVYWDAGKALCRRPTGKPGCELGVVENDTNNSLSGIAANAVGDVQVDGACATVNKELGALVSGDIVDVVLNEFKCKASAGYGPLNLMKLSASAAYGATTCAGTLSSDLRRAFNSLLTL